LLKCSTWNNLKPKDTKRSQKVSYTIYIYKRETGEPDTGEPDTGEPDTGEPDTGESGGAMETGEVV
jgi:hypothetical protein